MIQPTSSMDFSDVTLAVLAGGSGLRMGIPKAWLRIDETPILAWLLDRAHWPGPTMLVTAPAVSHPPAAELFDCHAVDPVDDQGPLRGVLTALNHMVTPIALVITVDMPALERRHLVWLLEMLAVNPASNGIMCRVKRGTETEIEPFPSAYRVAATHWMTHRMEIGRRSVQGLCSEPSFSAVTVPADWSAAVWTNLNYPEEFAAFELTQKNKETEKIQ